LETKHSTSITVTEHVLCYKKENKYIRQSGIVENGRRDRTIRGEVTTDQQAAE
jgi:hypothetical protein